MNSVEPISIIVYPLLDVFRRVLANNPSLIGDILNFIKTCRATVRRHKGLISEHPVCRNNVSSCMRTLGVVQQHVHITRLSRVIWTKCTSYEMLISVYWYDEQISNFRVNYNHGCLTITDIGSTMFKITYAVKQFHMREQIMDFIKTVLQSKPIKWYCNYETPLYRKGGYEFTDGDYYHIMGIRHKITYQPRIDELNTRIANILRPLICL